MSNVAKLTMSESSFEFVAHPLANTFPMIEGRKFEELKANIKDNGILVQIVLFQGSILDGRNRYAAAKAVGHKFSPKDFREFEGSLQDAEDFAISANINRRHLTNLQKQEVIRKMIVKYPQASNRQIAKKCGLSAHSTVAVIREKLQNPHELKKFRAFKETWEELPDFLLRFPIPHSGVEKHE